MANQQLTAPNLGHIISKDGLKPDPWLKTILADDVAQVRQFGLAPNVLGYLDKHFVLTRLRQNCLQAQQLCSAAVELKTSMSSMKTTTNSDNLCLGFKLLSSRIKQSGGLNKLFITARNVPGELVNLTSEHV